MSDKQKEASAVMNMATVYQQVLSVFDEMPERFTSSMLFGRLGGVSFRRWGAFAAVLERDFKCSRNAKGVWIKP